MFTNHTKHDNAGGKLWAQMPQGYTNSTDKSAEMNGVITNDNIKMVVEMADDKLLINF